jgi:4-amino-4-deoxy-L-arabinose transferase-like glycosyltransferase
LRDRKLILEMLTVAGFCAFLQYFGAAAIGLTGADEPRYAEIAREMLARHDWVTPVLYGQPWFEKPVLYYWSAMVSYRLFGVSDWAARLPAATFATAAVFAVYAFLRRFRRGAQLDGALMTASSVALIGFARSAGPDMLLASSFTLAMLAWLTWRLTADAGAEEKRWLGAFYFFAAVGMLAKGPVAPALAGAIVVLYAVVRREPRVILKTLWLPGIALFCAVALPWYVLVELRHAEFFRVFILEHNLARFSTNLYQHKQPFWYYVPVVLLATLPWTVYWVAAVVDGFRRWREKSDGVTQFLLVWTFVVLVFFSVSQSKLPGYILPALPACTLLAAEYVARRAGERPRFGLVVAHAAVVATLVAGVLLLPYALAHASNTPRIAAGVLAGLVFFGVGWTVYARGLRLLRFVTLAPMIVLLAFVLRAGAPAIDARVSYRGAAEALDQIDGRRSELAIYKSRREAEYGMAYYRNQVVARYERGEVPAGDHMVMAPPGAEADLARLAGGRRVSLVGEYPPAKLAFYWISPAMAMKMENPH